jgi:hypothetical protein
VSATSQDIAREVDRFIRERGVTKLPAAYAAESTASLSESDRAALHARPPEVESIATSAHAKSVKRKLAAETDPTKKAEMQRRLDAYSKRLGMAISAGKRRHAAASTSPRAISVTVPSPKPKSQEKPAMPSALRAVTPPRGRVIPDAVVVQDRDGNSDAGDYPRHRLSVSGSSNRRELSGARGHAEETERCAHESDEGNRVQVRDPCRRRGRSGVAR